MMTSRRAAWITAILILTGCTTDPAVVDDDSAGELGHAAAGSGAGSADPNVTFETQVKPNVTVCVACHSGGLAPNLTSYAALEARFKVAPGASNPLVTKGAHAGPAFTTAQRTAIVSWIDSLPASAPTPSQTFDAQVKPIVSLNCTACHNGSVMPNLTSYAALEGKFKAKPGASNPLVTKGAHAGPALTTAQRNTIARWIDSLPDPSQTYDTDVKPIVSLYCTACHNASLPPNLTSYATLAARYKVKPGATNPLVTKSIHEGPALTAAQRSTIANWVDSQP